VGNANDREYQVQLLSPADKKREVVGEKRGCDTYPSQRVLRQLILISRIFSRRQAAQKSNF
jgi:hypothetical protein